MSTWYVDASAAPGGNGSQALPWQPGSIGTISNGDTVLYVPGNYTQLLINGATPLGHNDITIGVASDGDVNFSGRCQINGYSGVTINGGVSLVRRMKFLDQFDVIDSPNAYFRFLEWDCETVAVNQPPGSGLFFLSVSGSSSGFVAEDCYAEYSKDDGFHFTSVGCTATRCEIRGTGNDGVAVAGSSTIQDCTIAQVDGWQALVNPGAHSDGIGVADDAVNVVIQRNNISNFGQCVFAGFTGNGFKCINNVIWKTFGTGLGNLDRGIAFRVSLIGTSNTYLVANNTIDGFEGGAAIGITTTSATSPAGLVNNNICTNCDSSIVTDDDPAVGGNNLFFGNSDVPDPSWGEVADPLYINKPAQNFNLQSGSPAIGEGENLSTSFTTDINGSTRTLPWDIGAYAFAVETLNITTLNATTLTVG